MRNINRFDTQRLTTSVLNQNRSEETNAPQVLSEPGHLEALDEIIGNPLEFQKTTQTDETNLEIFDPNSVPDFYEGVGHQHYEMGNDYGNQIEFDPMHGMNNGELEGYIAQFDKIHQAIKDQVIQYDQKTVRQGTWPYGVDITTTYDENGNTTGKLWKHDNGVSAYANSDAEYTFFDSNGNEITHDQYEEESGSVWGFFKKLFGGQGNSNITAETDVMMFGNFIDCSGNQLNHGAMLVNDGQDSNIVTAENLFAAVQPF